MDPKNGSSRASLEESFEAPLFLRVQIEIIPVQGELHGHPSPILSVTDKRIYR